MSDSKLRAAEKKSQALTAWERERDRLKTLWIIAVVIFWLSVVFQTVLYYIQDGLFSFVLLSIIVGTMVLGVILKIRVQLHLNKKVK